jgi:hypothetical protein
MLDDSEEYVDLTVRNINKFINIKLLFYIERWYG